MQLDYVRCDKCSKSVSNALWVEKELVVRAFVECPGCVEKKSNSDLKDRRCGTCDFWQSTADDYEIGFCICPSPDSCQTKTQMHMHEGESCSFWRKRKIK